MSHDLNRSGKLFLIAVAVIAGLCLFALMRWSQVFDVSRDG